MRASCVTGVFLALLLVLSTNVQAQDFIYTTNQGTITITQYTGPGGSVTIPGVITGLPVTGIGGSAFTGLTNLTSVTIPDSVTAIDDGGAPQGGAFGFCSHLTNVSLGSNLTNIGDFAFAFCAQLSRITLGQNLTRVGAESFRGCASLTGVSLPNSVASIEEGAFWACTSLTNAPLGNSLTNIGDSAFWFCPGLTNMTIAASVVAIGEGAFGYGANLTAISVDPANNVYCSIGGVLFNKARTTLIACPGAIGGSYRIPEGVDVIEGSAFAGCSSLTNLILPNGLTDIGNYAFYGCVSLPDITIPATVTNIEDFAFEQCTSLTGTYFKGDAPHLGGLYVFDNANQTTVYYLPGTTLWTSKFGGRPAVLWNPIAQTMDGSFGVQRDHFGFNISGTADIPLVVEASGDLGGSWLALQSCTLTNGLIYFSDARWTNYSRRFYRIRSP